MLNPEHRQELINMIYETNALKVADPKNPFWYTAGTIGPYYINTQFLFGGEEAATKLLGLIDEHKDDRENGPKMIADAIDAVYQEGGMFTRIMDIMVGYIKENIDSGSYDVISGGERRDWFFSFQAAKLLNKPHVTIYKDATATEFMDGETKNIESLEGKHALHIADLVTVASSYDRAWVPALRNLGGSMKYSVNVLDRNQGGGDVIKNLGVEFHALVTIDDDFLTKSVENNYLTQEQADVIANFMKDPNGSMKQFLLDNPDFLQNALNSDDAKTRERAQLCKENDMYGLEA